MTPAAMPGRVFAVRTLHELAELITALPDVRPMGGGTLLVPSWLDEPAPGAVVHLPSIGELRHSGPGYCGAATSLKELVDGSGTPQVLREAAESIGGPAVRASATVGGNIAAASPGCVSVGLLALDATATVLGRDGGSRDMPVAEAIGVPEGVITRVHWPAGREIRSALGKVTMRAHGGPVVATVAIARREDGFGALALGGTGLAPQRLRHAEAAWHASPGRAGAAAEAAGAASGMDLPLSGSDLGAAHRRAVIAALIRRLIAIAYGRSTA